MHKLTCTLLFMTLSAFIITLAHAAPGPGAKNDPCFFAPGYGAPVNDAKTALSNFLKTCTDQNAPHIPVKDGNGRETWGCQDEFAVFGKAAIRVCPAETKYPRIQWTCDEIRSTGEKLIEKCQKDGLVGGKINFKDPGRGYMKIIFVNWK